MSEIDHLFAKLRAENKKALMPFVTAGDPDLQFTAELLRTAVSHGGSLCELGIPYSDPVADGPTIQASYTRALDSGVRLADIFTMLGETTPALPAPVVTMTSYAIIYRQGLQQYVAQAKASGVAGAIVPDLPVEEAQRLSALCQQEDFSLIQLVTPTTPPDRALRIAEQSTGFLYYVSVTGITGKRQDLPPELVDRVGWLREQTDLPICIGFGISKPEHVQMLKPVADGLIVGSAIVQRVAEVASQSRADVLANVGEYIGQLSAALNAE